MKPYSKLCTLALLVCLGISQLCCQLAVAHQSGVMVKKENLSERPQGGVAGGGGNGILCNDGKYYSYDFITTEGGSGTLNHDIEKMRNAEEILKYISFHLRPKLPLMADSLDDFIIGIRSTAFDISACRIWIPGSNPLKRVYDESDLRSLIGCQDANQTPKIYQAVIRVKNLFGVVQYNMDQTLMAALAANSPWQLSFLYIHEWLRDFTTDTNALKDVTRLFHETEWLDANTEELLSALQKYNMGSLPLPLLAPGVYLPDRPAGSVLPNFCRNSMSEDGRESNKNIIRKTIP